MTAARPVFYVSDGTGITAETIGHSLLTQFTGTPSATDRIPSSTASTGRATPHAHPRGGRSRGTPGGGRFLRRRP